jgi:hypothetical protein
MYSRVIMPLDGSNLAEHILPYVRVLANGLQVPVDIVRVVEPAEFLATLYKQKRYEEVRQEEARKWRTPIAIPSGMPSSRPCWPT